MEASREINSPSMPLEPHLCNDDETDSDQPATDTIPTDFPDWCIRTIPTIRLRGDDATRICPACREKLAAFIPSDQWTLSDTTLLGTAHVDGKSESTCPMCLMMSVFGRGDWATVSVLDLRCSRPNEDFVMPGAYMRKKGYGRGLRGRRYDDGVGFGESGQCVAAVEPRKIDFESLKAKLALCLEKHESCCGNDGGDVVPGMHVIDCRTRKIEPIRQKEAYVALSYVWGQAASPEAHSGIPLVRLPSTVERTIEDAMVVTLSMGYTHLWVDKYCIDQADVDGKQDQIRRMDSIYNNSAFTIVAAAGDGGDYGLPGVETRLGTRPRIPRMHCRIGNILVCCQSAFANNSEIGMERYRYPQNELVAKSRWNTRGWTYQEGLLSRRSLVFTDEQVSFACRLVAVDAGSESRTSLDMPRSKYSSYLDPVVCSGTGDSPDTIMARIDLYSLRSLTWSSDALNGFSGILRAFRKMDPPVHHLWGVPILHKPELETYESSNHNVRLHSFLSSLSWLGNGRLERRPDFPTWSWTGWGGPLFHPRWDPEGFTVNYNLVKDNPFRMRVELVDGTVLAWKDLHDRNYLANDPDKLSRYLLLDAWILEVRVQWLPMKGRRRAGEYALHASIADGGDQLREPVELEWSCDELENTVKSAGSEGVVCTSAVIGPLGQLDPRSLVLESVRDVAGGSHFERRGILDLHRLLSLKSHRNDDTQGMFSRRLIRLG